MMLRLRRAALSLPLFFMVFLTGCSVDELRGFGFEEGVTSVNDTSMGLWQGAWVAAGVVGLITLILILWPIVFHRKKNEEFPKQTQYNVPVEVAYTVIPFIIVAVLFAYTARAQNEIKEVTPVTNQSVKVHDITVNAIQWSWQFTYKEAGPDATVTGTPAQPPTLYMPLGEKVRFKITASDVVHGFWVPAFMIQIQNIPGVENQIEFTAQKLGTYPGRCNILCGRQHSQMLFDVKVVTPAEYQSYIESLRIEAEGAEA
ncbi:MAG: cytochrome c oxidase subunit II [Actinobacteria bacterium]|jgi:cytochrome c oxidase subunit 2|nr:cytochrome c oxidase subunit II [Actinomycetota bacterium]NDB08014.1 cytochrome c oxidase subunit II [Actinomycetota bacterium]NDI10690.1 cytochrome c oxidase subunit II [Actinomycetota bacterium]